MQTGWTKVKNKWYYLNSSGVMQTGWRKVKNKWYYLNSSGAMQTGWTKVKNKWYYLNSSGVMQTGWKKIKNKWYYLYGNGEIAANTIIDGYKVDAQGVYQESKPSKPNGSKPVLDVITIENEIVRLVNNLRLDKGELELKNDSRLKNGARIRAKEIKVSFSHTRPNGTNFDSILEDSTVKYDWRASGENIVVVAKPISSSSEISKEVAQGIYESWFYSQGHYNNMVSSNFKDIGVGIHINGYTVYGVQLFGTEW